MAFLVETICEIKTRRPARRACALLTETVVELGAAPDYKGLAAYHYRDHRYPPAVPAVYRARHVPTYTNHRPVEVPAEVWGDRDELISAKIRRAQSAVALDLEQLMEHFDHLVDLRAIHSRQPDLAVDKPAAWTAAMIAARLLRGLAVAAENQEEPMGPSAMDALGLADELDRYNHRFPEDREEG